MDIEALPYSIDPQEPDKQDSQQQAAGNAMDEEAQDQYHDDFGQPATTGRTPPPLPKKPLHALVGQLSTAAPLLPAATVGLLHRVCQAFVYRSLTHAKCVAADSKRSTVRLADVVEAMAECGLDDIAEKVRMTRLPEKRLQKTDIRGTAVDERPEDDDAEIKEF